MTLQSKNCCKWHKIECFVLNATKFSHYADVKTMLKRIQVSHAFLNKITRRIIRLFFCRWLQAAQNFREQQDKQENGQMRESYRIRLGEAKK